MKKEMDAKQHEFDMQRKAFEEELASLRKMQEESKKSPATEAEATAPPLAAEPPAPELAAEQAIPSEAAASDGGTKTPDASKPVEASEEVLVPAPAAAMQACVFEYVFVSRHFCAENVVPLLLAGLCI
jgi:hypothetical protein